MGRLTRTVSGEIASFQSADVMPMSVVAQVVPVQSGTGDPSPTNVRPITGWTGCNIRKTGKNLISGEKVKNTILDRIGSARRGISEETPDWVWFKPNESDGYPSIFGKFGDYCQSYKYKENTQYTFAFQVSSQNDNNKLNMGISYTDGTIREFTRSDIVDGNWIVYTTDANKTVSSFYVGLYTSRWTSINYKTMGVYEGIVALSDIQGQKSETHSITFPSEAGTVYGGSLTVNEDGTGTLTVDMAQTTIGEITEIYDGTAGTQKYIGIPCNGILKTSTTVNAISDAIKFVVYADRGNAWEGFVYTTQLDKCGVFVPSTATLSEINNALQGKNIVYKLTTPVIYFLTAAEVGKLTAMQGINNVWCDTGNTSATYNFCDHLFRKRQTLLNPHIETVSGDIATFKTNLAFSVKNLTVNIDPVQAGSGDPAPDNIRPITGRTGVTLYKTRDNIFGGDLLCEGITSAMSSAVIDTEEKTVRFGASYTANLAFTTGVNLTNKFKENTRYTFIFTYKKSSGVGSNMRVYYTNGTYDAIPSVSSSTTKETTILVTPANKTVLRLSKTNNSGTTYIYYDESGIFEGVLTADNFKAYEGQKISVSFPSEAGTVYGGTLTIDKDGGGTLTVKKGLFTVTKAKLDALGSGYYGWESTYGYGAWCRNLNYYQNVDRTYHSGNAGYRNVSSAVATCVVNNSSISSSQYRTSFMSEGWTSYQDFYDTVVTLENNGTPLTYVANLYQKATYALTSSQVKSLIGQNNVWADTGEISDLKYWKQ